MIKFNQNRLLAVLLLLPLILAACGGGDQPIAGASPNSLTTSSSNFSPSFLPTSNAPPSAQMMALQMEGARLNSEELAQIATTGMLPVPFDGPLLSGAQDSLKPIEKSSTPVTQLPQIRLNATLGATQGTTSLTPAYRFYNNSTLGHFYTTSTAERDNLIANFASILSYEGASFFTSSTSVSGLSPVHRFYNTQNGVHFFTITESERAFVAANFSNFKYEGIAYYASTIAGTGLTPLYRFYYKSKGFHFYTNSIAERDNIIATLPSYTYEGIGYYVLNSDWQATNVPGTNAAPVANAGVVQNVVAGSSVTLDGSASSDANGDPLTYAWSLTSKPTGSAAVLSLTTSVKPTFTADVAGTYAISLVVNDGKVNSTTATVAVTATAPAVNATPVANAGSAQNVLVGNVVTLNGRGSSDANGDTLTYMWTGSSPPGSSATLIGASTVAPTFTADVAGIYVISLVVSDGKVSSVPATVTITTSVPLPAAVTLYLYSGETTPVYLGCLTCSQFNVESVCNKFGTYGSEFQSRSIWNQFGTYGSQFNTYSAWNQFSSNGPAIIGSDNLFYGYFTVNKFRSSRTTIQSYVNILNFYSTTNNLASTRTYACGN